MTLFLLGIVFLLVILHWATRGASPSNLGHREEGGSGSSTTSNMANNVCICVSNRVGTLVVGVLTMILAVSEVLAAFGEHILRAGGDHNAYLFVVEVHALMRAWSVTSWIDFLAALMLVYGVLNKHVNSLTMWIVFKCFLLSMSAVSTLYASFHQQQHESTNSPTGFRTYRGDRIGAPLDSAFNESDAWTGGGGGSYPSSSSSLYYNPVAERRENPFGIPFPLATALLFPLQILCVYVVHKYRNEILIQELLRSSFHGASTTRNGAACRSNAGGEQEVGGGTDGGLQNFRFISPTLFAYTADEVNSNNGMPPRNDHPPAYDEVAKHEDKLPTYLEAVNGGGGGSSSNSENSAVVNATDANMPTTTNASIQPTLVNNQVGVADGNSATSPTQLGAVQHV